MLPSFPFDIHGRTILPPLARRSRFPHKSSVGMNIALPTLPDLLPQTAKPSRRLSKYQSPARNALGPLPTHQRIVSFRSDISSSSSSSDESDASTHITTPSSRSASPEGFSCSSPPVMHSAPSYPTPTPQGPNTAVKLIPRAPFPADVRLEDISGDDALVFFPEGDSSSASKPSSAGATRALLLMGPAIARHLHSARRGSISARGRAHPYRIALDTPPSTKKPLGPRRPSLVDALRWQVEQAKKCPERWEPWMMGEQKTAHAKAMAAKKLKL